MAKSSSVTGAASYLSGNTNALAKGAGASNFDTSKITKSAGIPANNSNIPPANFAVPELNSNITGLKNTKTAFNPGSSSPSSSSGGSAAPPPKRSSASIIKEKLLKPAHTSHFECHFNPPSEVISWCSGRDFNPIDPNNQRLITLSCSETSLPGSRIATAELQDDHHGVTERHAYRRQFDETASFTFYVDAPKDSDPGYRMIWFFEQWKSFIMNEGDSGGSYNHIDGSPVLDDYNWYYRAKFPETYMTDIFITKFEKDYDLRYINPLKSKSRYLEYKFLQAYPISINSMPVSYDQSQLLKCTVSFAYSRYIVRRKGGSSGGGSLFRPTSDAGPIPTNRPSTPPADPSRTTGTIPTAAGRSAGSFTGNEISSPGVLQPTPSTLSAADFFLNRSDTPPQTGDIQLF